MIEDNSDKYAINWKTKNLGRRKIKNCCGLEKAA